MVLFAWVGGDALIELSVIYIAKSSEHVGFKKDEKESSNSHLRVWVYVYKIRESLEHRKKQQQQ